ncbi:Hypothetical protein PHPALM_6625 [Phytophthora palmivora]|uniref:Uncharacterized protein n=1 Tax=Phytophthora palmivora TaxID=4796 RepID=A0A2P4YEF1_9STRA|nr:Hypothetical protein PHPALM_6625 [Phytophthora palmivora]
MPVIRSRVRCPVSRWSLMLDLLTVIIPEQITSQKATWTKLKIKIRRKFKVLEYTRGKWKQFWQMNISLGTFHLELNVKITPQHSLKQLVRVIKRIAREHVVHSKSIIV